MNLPLSQAVNPALASALLTVSSPAPALASTAGSAASLREDFAQHFARMARQNQARPTQAEPAPQRQQLATQAQHRPDARFAAAKHAAAAPTQAPPKEPQSNRKVAEEGPAPDAADPKITPQSNTQPSDADMAKAPSQAPDTPTATAESRASEEVSAADTKEALPPGSEVPMTGLIPDGLKTLQISERLQIITTDQPLPDPQSNAQFARSMGFDEQMIQRLFGPAPASALSTAAGPGATPVLISGGETAAAMGQPPLFTVSADAAKAMAGLGAASAVTGQGLSTVGELQALGAHSMQITELADNPAATLPAANLNMPSVSTQNMLAMLSAFVPNADSKRSVSEGDNRALDSIDLSDLVGETPGSALNLGSPSSVRNNAMGSAANPSQAPTSTDMAQAYQDLSDKLSTELAGRMHQQLNEGQWKMKLGLKPSHLGAVDVELEMRDGKLSAVINADNATTQQLLNQGSPRLREALNALGWTQSSVNIGQGQSSSAQSGQGQGQHPGSSGQHTSRGESIHGDVADASPRKTQNASNALLDIYA